MTPTDTIIQETKKLILSVKRNYLAIAVNVYKLHESKEWGDEWPEFYQTELELKKSQVSKLLRVGEFVLANGFVKATVGYEALYSALNAFPEKDPKYILAAAETWSPEDFKANAKEECKNHEWIEVCKTCWKRR